MSIRIKVYAALLVLSLSPLLVAGMLARNNIAETRATLTESTRERITTIANDTRRHLVQKHAAILERDRALIEIDVRAAAEALRRLSSVGPPDEFVGKPFYTSEQFDDPADPPPGLRADPTMQRIAADGTRRPLMVSEQSPVFVVQPETDVDLLRVDASLLLALVPTMDAVREDAASLIRPATQYAAFDRSGLHMSWPGKGGYPAGYDPRDRAWYVSAVESDEATVWIPPVIDAPTGQVRITCAAAVYGDDGGLIGVTAADVMMRDIIAELDLPAAFREESSAMIVVNTPDIAENGDGPVIIANAAYDDLAGSRWDTPIELQSFNADGDGSGSRLARAMLQSDNGSMDLVLDDEPWVWTWERLSDGSTNVLVGISLAAADRAADEVAAEIGVTIDDTVRQNLGIGLGAMLALVVVGFFGSRSITRPISDLASTASAIADGDLDARAEVRSRDELGSLAESFNSMVPKLRDRLHVREALELAREVQQNLLPASAPVIPGFDVAARSVYCDETGGDYFDFFDLSDIAPGKHAVVVGDVTGHGIAAALLMTTARALLHARVTESDEMAGVIGRVNANLARDARSGQFMTLFYLLLDAETRHARWVSAGHDAAIVFDSGTGEFNEYPGHDIPLGIEGAWVFNEASEQLPARAIAVIGTDGIWEARSPDGEMYGKDRFRETIRRHAEHTSDEIADAILADVTAFRAGGDQADDITVVILKTNPNG